MAIMAVICSCTNPIRRIADLMSEHTVPSRRHEPHPHSNSCTETLRDLLVCPAFVHFDNVLKDTRQQ